MYIATHVIDIQTANYPTGSTDYTVTNEFPEDASIIGIRVETIGGNLDGSVWAHFDEDGDSVDIFSAYFVDSNRSTAYLHADTLKDYSPSYTVNINVSYLVETQSEITLRITYYYESSVTTEFIYRETTCNFVFGNDGTAIGTLSTPIYNIESVLNCSAETESQLSLIKNTELFACDSIDEADEERNKYGNIYCINIEGNYTLMCGILIPNADEVLRNHKRIVAKPQNASFPTQNVTVTYTIAYVERSPKIKYYDGSAFLNCHANYYDGTQFVRCDPYIYDGSDWIPCNAT